MGRDQATRVVGLALLVGVYAYLTAPWVMRRGVGLDEWIFLDVGRNLVATGLPIRTYGTPPVMFFDHTPGYTYLSGLAVALAGDGAIGLLRILSWLSGLGTAVVLFLALGGWRGLLAGLAVVTAPMVNHELSWYAHMELPMMLAIAVSLWLLSTGRIGWAGLAAMVAVTLKEFALLYVLVVGLSLGRGFARFAAPSFVACALFLAYAAYLDAAWLHTTMLRWVDNASGDPQRFAGSGFDWLTFAVPQLGLAALGALAVLRPPRALGVYVIAAVAVSLVLATKEARWMAGAIPAGAFAIGLYLRHADERGQERRGRACARAERRGPRGRAALGDELVGAR